MSPHTFIIYHKSKIFKTNHNSASSSRYGSHTGGSSRILLYASLLPLGRLASLSVAGDLALRGCLLELYSREKVKDRRVGVTNIISKCLVERFKVVVDTVEVRLHSISLVPGFRWEVGCPRHPLIPTIQGLRDVVNNGVEEQDVEEEVSHH